MIIYTIVGWLVDWSLFTTDTSASVDEFPTCREKTYKIALYKRKTVGTQSITNNFKFG